DGRCPSRPNRSRDRRARNAAPTAQREHRTDLLKPLQGPGACAVAAHRRWPASGAPRRSRAPKDRSNARRRAARNACRARTRATERARAEIAQPWQIDVHARAKGERRASGGMTAHSVHELLEDRARKRAIEHEDLVEVVWIFEQEQGGSPPARPEPHRSNAIS